MKPNGASTAAGRRRVAARAGAGSGASAPRPKPPAAVRSSAKKPAAKRPKLAKPTKAAKRPAGKKTVRRPSPSGSRRPVAAGGPSLAERLPSLPRVSLPAFRLPRPSLPRIGELRLPRPSLARIAELRLRRLLVIAAVAAAALFAFYYGWFRDSSLVSVKHVTVEGVAAPEGDQVVAALTDAAKGMSTLNVDEGRLSAAVAGFPIVAGVSAAPSFPSGMTITVTERPPALIASDGNSEVPVAGDGTILSGVDLPKSQAAKLPVLAVQHVRTSGRLAGTPLSKALVIGAAPAPLRPLIEGAKIEPGTGAVVTMKGGFRVEFGSSAQAARKWAAAAAVLADPQLHSLTYVDVRIPKRPAVGGS
ncbi:MAG: cell division protein FtsQ [Solirubrobacterales bacterium]|nr:cell division protein FtsQ [Solirubrobacterales bacterium]